jgi:hypothetical protein
MTNLEEHNLFFSANFLKLIKGLDHYEYEIEIRCLLEKVNKRPWKIRKRFNDFNKLLKTLINNYNLKVPPLPAKMIKNNMSPRDHDERQ